MGLIAPIYFNVKEPREFLLATGFVYTLRKPRSVGKTVAVQGGYYNHVKLCDVRVFLIKEKPSIADLHLYVIKSGFDDVVSWLTAAKIDDPAMLSFFNLYRVVRVMETPHCALLTNHTVKKDRSCVRSDACAATGAWTKHPHSPALIFYPDLTKHPLCTIQSQASDSLARQEAEKMSKKRKVVPGKVALDLGGGKSVKREEKAPSPADVAIAKVEEEIAAKPAVEDMTKPEVAASTVKATVTKEQVLAAMVPGETYTTAVLREKFQLDPTEGRGAGVIRQIMKKLEADKKVVVTEQGSEGKRPYFAYKLA